MNKLIYIIVAVAVLLTPFSDSPLRNTFLGFLGSSISFIPIVLSIFLIFLQFLFNKKRLNNYLLFGFAWIILISVYGLIIYGNKFWNINLLDKGFRLIILFLLFLAPLVFSLNKKIIRFGFIYGFMILILGLFWIDVFNNQYFLHSLPNGNMRPRSFTLESSNLSIVLLSFSTVLIDQINKIKYKIVFGIATLLILIYSNSKGGLAILIGGFVTLFLFQIFHTLIRKKFSKLLIYLSPILFVFCIGLIFLTQRVVDELTSDINNYSSTATRSVLTLSSILVAIQHPLGVGMTGFLPALVNNIPSSINFLNKYSPTQLNFSEVNTYVDDRSDQNISTKSFLLDGLVYFGLPFPIFYLYGSILLLNKLFKKRLWVLFIGSASLILGLITFSSGLGLYIISFAINRAISRASNRNLKPHVVKVNLPHGLELTQ